MLAAMECDPRLASEGCAKLGAHLFREVIRSSGHARLGFFVQPFHEAHRYGDQDDVSLEPNSDVTS